MNRINVVEIAILTACLFLSCGKDWGEAFFTVNVTEEDLTASWSFSDVFDDLELIPLETCDTVLLGHVNKLICTDEYYYLCTKVHVYVFDKNGHFCHRVGEMGHGRYEYVELSSIRKGRARCES